MSSFFNSIICIFANSILLYMESAINIRDLSLRLLGYYNEEGQEMSEETIYPQEAEELASLLDVTFSDISTINNEDVINQDEGFSDALKTGVFVMRDRESHLYAYWPQKKIARITGVLYNRDAINILPLEYKSWFAPGEALVISQKGSTNVDFFTYLRNLNSIGKPIVLSLEGTISGKLDTIGKDFITIKNANNQLFVVNNHMCLQINPKVSVDAGAPDEETDDIMIPAMGVIIDYYEDSGLGHVRTNSGEIYGLRYAEMLDEALLSGRKIGQKVVFSTRYEKHGNGKSMIQAISVHSPGSIKELLQLADRLNENGRKSDAIEVLEHILAVDDDNEKASSKKEIIKAIKAQDNNTNKDDDTIQFEQACEKQNNGQIQEAIDAFTVLLEEGKHVKECVPRIAACHWSLYQQAQRADDEDYCEVKMNDLVEFVKTNHSKLNPAASLNFRLNYYYKLNLTDEYLQTIDTELQNSSTDTFKRAKLLYYKASKYLSLGKEVEALSFAKESLYFNPLNNKAELIVQKKSTSSNNKEMLSTLVAGGELLPMLYQQSIGDVDAEKLFSEASQTNRSNIEPKILLQAVIANKDNDTKLFHSQSLIADYLFKQAHLFSQKGNLESAVYYWSQLFQLIPGFGYYVQKGFARMLSDLLGVSIVKDETLETYNPWENQKEWNEILSDATISNEQWDLLLYAIQTNDDVLTYLSDTVVKERTLFSSLLNYLNLDSKEEISNEDTLRLLKEFTQKTKVGNKNHIILQAIDERLNGKEKLSEKCDALGKIELGKSPFSSLLQPNLSYLRNLCRICVPKYQSYVLASNIESRLNMAKELLEVVDRQIADIFLLPTQFGVEGIACILTDIRNSLLDTQEISTKSAAPVLSVQVLTDPVSPDENGEYKIVVRVSNAETSATAKSLSFTVLKSDDLQPIMKSFFVGRINGGESFDYWFTTKLNLDPKKESHWTFALKCIYSFEGTKFEKVFSPLQVHLKQPGVFAPIEVNPYTCGQGLSYDDPTFVGRQEEIQKIINDVLHPQRTASQLIVYGQKRCGKTSLVQAVQSKLEKEYSDLVWCVYTTLCIEGDEENLYSEARFLWNLLNAIRFALANCQEENKPVLSIPAQEIMEASQTPTQLFCEAIAAFKKSMKDTIGWERRRLVLIIDEFTVLYGSIKDHIASEYVLHHWKSIQESDATNFVTIFVGHDITPKFFGESYAKNPTRIIDPYLLTYLDNKAARELIERPIAIEGKSRFEEEAVKRILDYTAGSPWYLQIFMKKMVDYINETKTIMVSKIDVDNVARRFVEKQYSDFNRIEDFDELINSGLASKYCVYSDSQIEIVLRSIAKRSNETDGWCWLTDVEDEIVKCKDVSLEDLKEILKDLETRNVIETQDNNQLIRIKVELFRQWLIRN